MTGLGNILESGHADRIRLVREGSHNTVQRTMQTTYVTDLNQEEDRALDALSQKYSLIEAFERKSQDSSKFLGKEQEDLKRLDLEERQAQANIKALEQAFSQFDDDKHEVRTAHLTLSGAR